jgi:hypothetical protein
MVQNTFVHEVPDIAGPFPVSVKKIPTVQDSDDHIETQTMVHRTMSIQLGIAEPSHFEGRDVG